MRHSIVIAIVVVCLSASAASAQFVQQGSKLIGTGATGAAAQGRAVALSADGNTAIVGGQSDNGGAGAAWIFTRSNGTWSQQGSKLVGSGAGPGSPGGALQGWTVAISGDGNTAIVGGPFDSNDVGAAWIFVRSGTTWSQQGSKLIGSGATGKANQGWAVALSADGNTALMGGIVDNNSIGAAWVFTRSGTTWTQQSKLVGTGSSGQGEQGFGVSLAADGNTAVVGGPGDNAGAGAMWVFTRSGSTWTQQGSKLTGTGATGTGTLGGAVAVSADGNTAAACGTHDSSNMGACWVFARGNGTWTEQGSKLVGTGAGGSLVYQGTSVALSGNGNVLIEGGVEDASGTGAAWVFTRAGQSWSQLGAKLVGTGVVPASAGAGLGQSVSLSTDGRTAMVGGWTNNNSEGATWVFTWPRVPQPIADFDGDAHSDIAVYNTASGVWSTLTSTSGYGGATNIGWGGSGYTPVPGDYDGDGKTDLGVYQASSGNWYVLLSSTNFTTAMAINAGGTGWDPEPADYDGDGRTDFVVYNRTTGQWYGLKSSTNYTTSLSIMYGGGSWFAVPADYDGDGKTDIGVYEGNSGTWSVLLSSTLYTTSLSQSVGGAGYTPVPADFDGDGRADFAVYGYLGTGLWYALLSSSNYTTTLSVSWGGSGYTPVKGDFDGDGRADLALYVPSTSMWYILLSGSNYTTTIVRSWGGSGYAPVPGYPLIN
jgi:hypothetical protein